MSIVAQESRYTQREEAVRTEGVLALLIHPAALGTLVAAALCAALTWWFVSQARHELAEDAWNRTVIMQLQALGDTVAAMEARLR